MFYSVLCCTLQFCSKLIVITNSWLFFFGVIILETKILYAVNFKFFLKFSVGSTIYRSLNFLLEIMMKSWASFYPVKCWQTKCLTKEWINKIKTPKSLNITNNIKVNTEIWWLTQIQWALHQYLAFLRFYLQ